MDCKKIIIQCHLFFEFIMKNYPINAIILKKYKLNERAEYFKVDIDNIFEDSIYEENDKILIKVDFKKIMQNKSMFFRGKVIT